MQTTAATQPAGSASTGGWGFDLAGADFTKKPGDDFFRYVNGAWYHRAVIPPDRSSNGIFIALSMTAEARIRNILKRGEDGALDAQPIAPLTEMIRAAQTREELAGLMGTGRRSLL